MARQVCIGCQRVLFRKFGFWHDPYGHLTCAYRLAGLWLHKPGSPYGPRFGSPVEPVGQK